MVWMCTIREPAPFLTTLEGQLYVLRTVEIKASLGSCKDSQMSAVTIKNVLWQHLV
jgi:hypothetical protein